MKLLKIGIAIVVCLLAIRVALPSILLKFVTQELNKIPEYKVNIEDLDLNLYRGSYTLKNISLHKINKNIPVPFFKAKEIDLAIQWKPLLSGRVVGKIAAVKPEINFVIDSKGSNQQLTIDQEWQRAVKAIFPLNFNQLSVTQGKVFLRDFNGNPPFNIFLKDVSFVINNMQKVSNKNELLASNFEGNAKTMDGGDVKLDGLFDPFAKQPKFKLNASLKSMQVPAANNFLRHFTNVDVHRGQFSLFIEAAAANGQIKGYAKPIIKNLKIINPNEPMQPLEAIYKSLLEVASHLVTNGDKKTIATKIKIEGDIRDPDTSALSIIGYLLRHAFIQALLPQIDHNIQMRDVLFGKNPQQQASR